MSAASTRIQQFLANNATYASSFTGAPQMTQIQAMRGRPGAEILVILTCFDPRCVPEAFFGPDMRAAVFRNAGGRVTEDVIRSLHILRAVVSLELVAIVHHTDCGMSHATDQEVRAFAKPKTAAAAAVVDKMDFGMWKEEHLDETVKEDIRKLREETSLGDLEVLGFVLDTQKGAVREVET